MAWQELDGSPEITFSRDGPAARRRFIMPWSEWPSFCASLADGGVSGRPMLFPSTQEIYVSQIDIRPFQEQAPAHQALISLQSGLNSYGLAVAEVSYQHDYWQVQWPTDITKPSVSVGMLRLRIRGSTQLLKYPGRALKYEKDSPGADDPPPVPPDTQAAIRFPKLEIAIEWDGLYDPPISHLNNYVGSVNQSAYLNVMTEVLLFEGYDIDHSTRISFSASNCYRCTLNFTARYAQDENNTVYGWNHEYDDQTQSWRRVKLSDGSDRFPIKDFSGLFVP
jgi:hypothetical protein